MSRARARARAEREAAAAVAAQAQSVARERAAAVRARRDRRVRLWRRLRLWQHGPGFRRTRERWAALIVVVLVALVCTLLFTGSYTAVLFVALVALVGSPALVKLFFDRSPR